jgi:hypothetical protein
MNNFKKVKNEVAGLVAPKEMARYFADFLTVWTQDAEKNYDTIVKLLTKFYEMEVDE